MATKPYVLDPQFQSLLPVVEQKHDNILDADILRHKRVLKPLIVAVIEGEPHPVLGDGHRRDAALDRLRAGGHEIADPEIISLSFGSRGEAMAYMVSHQETSRPGWNGFQRVKAIEQNKALKDYIEGEAKKRMLAGVRPSTDPQATVPQGQGLQSSVQTSCDPEANVPQGADPVAIVPQGKRAPTAREQKAKAADVSDGYYKYAAEVLKHPELAAQVDKGEITPKQAYDALRLRVTRQREVQEVAEAQRFLPPRATGSGMNQIICADVLDGLKGAADNSVALIFTSVPYPIEKTRLSYLGDGYDGDYDAYLDWMEKVFAECFRVLRQNGRLVVNIDNCTCPEEPAELRRNTYVDFANIYRRIGYAYRDDAIWYKQNCVGLRALTGARQKWNARLQRNWEFIMIWGKGTGQLCPTLAEIDPSKTTVDRDDFYKWTVGHWEIVGGQRSIPHRCPFPEKLAERVIHLLSAPGDVVMDPFCGSGTTCAVAARLGRQYVGIDNQPQYVAYARQRVEEAKAERARLATLSVEQLVELRRQEKVAEMKQRITGLRQSAGYYEEILAELQGGEQVKCDVKSVTRRLQEKHHSAGPGKPKISRHGKRLGTAHTTSGYWPNSSVRAAPEYVQAAITHKYRAARNGSHPPDSQARKEAR